MHALALEIKRRKPVRHLLAYWTIGGANCSSDFRDQPDVDRRRRHIRHFCVSQALPLPLRRCAQQLPGLRSARPAALQLKEGPKWRS
jgi:hypothetical protein